MKLVIVAAAFAQLAASAATPPRIKLTGADMKHCLIQKTGDAVHSPNCDFSNGVYSLNSNAIAISENGAQIKVIKTRLEALELVVIKQTTELNLLRALNDKQHNGHSCDRSTHVHVTPLKKIYLSSLWQMLICQPQKLAKILF